MIYVLSLYGICGLCWGSQQYVHLRIFPGMGMTWELTEGESPIDIKAAITLGLWISGGVVVGMGIWGLFALSWWKVPLAIFGGQILGGLVAGIYNGVNINKMRERRDVVTGANIRNFSFSLAWTSLIAGGLLTYRLL